MEARWKVTEDSRLKRQRKELISKKVCEKKKKRKIVQKKKKIKTPCESNINTAFEGHVSSENYALW